MSKPAVRESKLKDWKEEDCYKGVEGCFCATGFAYEDMCPNCRDERFPEDRFSYCACPPKE